MRYLVVALVAGCGFSGRTTGETDAPMDVGKETGQEMMPGAWFDPAWTRRKPITIREAEIPGTAALVDFPVLISFADPQLALSALGSGADIVFTAGDAVTQLASEIELYGAGTLTAWVKIPSLSATADTTIYMYYGNPTPPAQPNAQTVWTGGFAGVWHLSQDPGPGATGDIKDSTAGNRDATSKGGMTANDLVPAQIGRGFQFDGTNKYVDFPSIDVGKTFTISMYFRLTNGGTGIKTLLSNSLSGLTMNGFRLFLNDDTTNNRKVLFETGDGANENTAETPTMAFTVNVMTRLDVVVDRDNANALIYLDGAQVATDTTIENDFNTNSDFEIARMEDIYLFPGIIDELEIASVRRSPEWIQATRANQRVNSTFQVPGPEETR